MNHNQAQEKLGKRDSRKLENNTYLQKRGEEIAIKLHETDIITMQENGVNILNTGGWQTVTTKDRLNKYSGVIVNQVKGQWYINTSLYYDGIKVKDGGVTSKEKKEDLKFNLYNGLIKAYCNKLKGLETLPVPDSGDCLYCSMYEEKTSKPIGEVFKDKKHLIAHLNEEYIHGSLIFNALKAAGYNNPGVIFQMDIRDSIVRAVRKYFKRQLGMVA